MNRVFFGLSNSMRILHYEVSKCFNGLEGCISIHNNLLVFGENVEGHNQNMKNMLERAKKGGITLKLSKSIVCAQEIQLFGRTFMATGILAAMTRSNTSRRLADQRISRR